MKLHPNPKSVDGDPNSEYIATLLNPVDHRLYDFVRIFVGYYLVAPLPNEAYADPRTSVSVFGEGNFDKYDSKEIDFEGTGTYYRSHTPSGVDKKKAGLGLMLYSGLALAAVTQSASGIYSQKKQRSSDATRWWSAQVQRGLAGESEYGEMEQVTVSVDIDEEMVEDMARQGSTELEDADEVSVIEGPDPTSVDVDVTLEGVVSLQVLPASHVAEAGLVVSWNDDYKALNMEMGGIEELPAQVIAEIDMSTVGDPDLVLGLFRTMVESEKGHVTEAQKQKFLKSVPDRVLTSKVKHELAEMLGQKRLPFGSEVAANPAPKVKHSKAWAKAFGAFI